MSNTLLPNPKINYNPQECLGEYGFWQCPHCEQAFYSGGEALHSKQCPSKGYKDWIYNFGDKEIQRLQKRVGSLGLAHFHGCWTELAILRLQEIENLAEKLEKYKQELIAVKEKELALEEYEAMKQFLLVS